MRKWRWAAVTATVALIVGVLQLASVSHATVASPLLLLNVVVVARLWGAAPALYAAGLGAAAYSYFFIPPEGFGLESPDDWIAFITFAVTAVIAGELASRAEQRAAEAQAGRQEIERLYQELQAAFERASDAEAARRNEALKAALLDALTHNLRTPLTAIKAAVTALIRSGLRREPELTVEGRFELLQIINEETDRLNRFIEGLAAADRTDRQQPAQLAAVAVETIVRAGVVRAETVTRGHHVRVEIAGDLPSVAVDASAMTEAIYIAIDNASKYTPVGSTITIRGTLDDEQTVRIAIADQGPGVPPEYRERVFERFFRVPGREPTTARQSGAGLGLSIARRLVDAQGGRVWIEPGPNERGTVVIIQLPVAVRPVAEVSEPQPVPVAAGS